MSKELEIGSLVNIDGKWWEVCQDADAADYKYFPTQVSIFQRPRSLWVRPWSPPEGDYDLTTEFTAEEWAKLVPGCRIQGAHTDPVTAKSGFGGLFLGLEDDGEAVVASELGLWHPIDPATAYIVGRRPKVKEPLVWEGTLSLGVLPPVAFAGKKVRVEVIE